MSTPAAYFNEREHYSVRPEPVEGPSSSAQAEPAEAVARSQEDTP